MSWYMSALIIIAYLVLSPLVGGILSGFDRVITARMQGRQGPPLLQPFYDIIKLFNKEAIIVNRIQVLLVLAYLIFSVFTGALFFVGGDILLVFFALTLSEVFLMLAACSASSPYSSMGAQRELLQMMAYEPMTLLAAIGFYMTSHSFMVKDIIASDTPAVIKLPGMFIGFAYILIIKFRKSPFDVSTSHHAHQEMVKGLTTDISGNIFGFVELAEWYENILMMAFLGLFFISSNPLSWLYAVIACLIVYFVIVLIDNIFPRVKWEALLWSAWIVTFFAGGANFLVLTVLK